MHRHSSLARRARRGTVLSAASFMTVALLCGSAFADSSVFLTNNTSKPIKVKITSTLGGKYWNKKSTYIAPFSRKEIFETNRDTGVKDGKTYTFTTEVLPQDPKTGTPLSQAPQPFALRLKLRGSTVGSHMWQSVRSQTGAQATWNDDRQKYSASMNVKGVPWTVTYWAYGAGNNDDVEYVIREKYPLPQGYGKSLSKEWKQSHLNVLSYNVYMRPTSLFVNGQSQRAKMIPPQLPGYDVVVFQEAFDDDTRAVLLNGMTKQGYKYHSKILGKDVGTAQDGGVIIVSRYPIAGQAQKLFGDVCTGWDCDAQKGVLYAKINKKVGGTNNYFHVFGTHLNNGDWGVQKQQLSIARTFIDSRNIAKNQAVVIAGDMNINLADTAKYNYMLDKLGAGYFPASRRKGHPYTHDGPLNDLGDGSRSNLDYVLYSKNHLRVTSASYAEVRIPRALMEWKDVPHEKAMWDLSDHYAVYGNMHFVFDPLGDWDPYAGGSPGSDDGPIACNTDADCPAEFRCEKSMGSGGSGGGTSSSKKRVRARARLGARRRVSGPESAAAPKAGATAKSGRPQARTASKANPASKASAAPKANPSSTKVSKVPHGKRPLMLKTGTCRIPPPK